MAKVKLKLQDKSDSELLTFSQQHIAAMTGNSNFTTPAPTVIAFQALHDEFEAALDAAALAAETSKQKTSTKDVKRSALERGLTDRGSYVDMTSGGIEAKILSSNLPVRDAAAPIGPMPAPIDFLATMGDMEGEMDLTWSRVRGAKSYIIQHSENVSPRVWSQKAVSPKSSATITGCTPGAICVFRVAAIGAAGQGPWSDESVKMAP
ncbi:MAG: fibronectin type III domain-containing protein [Verrucomicrobia bacterium]|nr:MAG: fibronectin type III domain-containing protein [Verrucomicrobiota bacterium]